MNRDPETVLRSAYEAVSSGNAAALVDLVDAESLEQLRLVQVQLAGAPRGSFSPDLYLGSVEEARNLPAQELLRRMLDTLPPARKHVRCHTLGHVLEEPDQAHVLFRVEFSPEAGPEPWVKVATLRKRSGEWRITATPLNNWVVPGMENVVFTTGHSAEPGRNDG